jgi:glycerophosphoryl diester phosphodiesterase
MELLGQLLRDKNMLFLAHGGDSSQFQECTYSAVKAALDRPFCAGVCLPLRKTQDGKIVVFPERSLARLTGLDLSVGDLIWKDLALLKVRKKVTVNDQIIQYHQSERLALLEDLLPEMCGLEFMVFLQFPSIPALYLYPFVREVAKLVHKLGMGEQVVLLASHSLGMLPLAVGGAKITTGSFWKGSGWKTGFLFQEWLHKECKLGVGVLPMGGATQKPAAHQLPFVGYHDLGLDEHTSCNMLARLSNSATPTFLVTQYLESAYKSLLQKDIA